MTARWEYLYKIDVGALYVYLDGNVKDNAERLEGELVHRMDLVEVVEDEVEDGGSRCGWPIKLSRHVDLPRRDLGLLHLRLNLGGSELGVLKVLHQR